MREGGGKEERRGKKNTIMKKKIFDYEVDYLCY
jgi:hypothetical protein